MRHARRPHTLQEETPRPAPPPRPQQARHDPTTGCPQWSESSAWRPAFRALWGCSRRGRDACVAVNAGALPLCPHGCRSSHLQHCRPARRRLPLVRRAGVLPRLSDQHRIGRPASPDGERSDHLLAGATTRSMRSGRVSRPSAISATWVPSTWPPPGRAGARTASSRRRASARCRAFRRGCRLVHAGRRGRGRCRVPRGPCRSRPCR